MCNKDDYVRVQVILHPDRDAEIIAWLERQDNKSAAVREAIRDSIAPTRPVTYQQLRAVIREELAHVRIADNNAPVEEGGDVDAEAADLLDSMF